MRPAGPIPPFAAFVLAALLSVGLWAWLGRPVALPDAPGGRLHPEMERIYRGITPP